MQLLQVTYNMVAARTLGDNVPPASLSAVGFGRRRKGVWLGPFAGLSLDMQSSQAAKNQRSPAHVCTNGF